MSTALKTRLAAELPAISRALDRAAGDLPASVRPIARHVLDAGGKRLRPFLTVLFARLWGYGKDDVYPLAAAMEMLHAATLLHDDVLDAAATRRGKPAAHTLFGVAPAILAGDALLSHANKLVAGYGDCRLSACFSEATVRTAAGEILEIDYQGRVDQPAEIYHEIIADKTAWLICASCEMGALRAGADQRGLTLAAQYGLELGMAFQLVDDALDFAPPEKTGKPSCGDLREGKLTPPLRLYREHLTLTERAAFDADFCSGGLDDNAAQIIGARIRELGFDARGRQLADAHLEKAHAALRGMPDAPERALLEHMIAHVRDRET
ncbi:MAG: polyprenyl synthetase family protein [Deltaproteobacteria bacterium]|jgi:octaprenyl-diphosphate synthase|nr:polyprenyl synthetase family protein [Deltaproteobacteria bacterium]